MSWYEIAIELKEEEIDKGTQALESMGALAVSFFDAKDNPIFEPPPEQSIVMWKEAIVVGLMSEKAPIKAIQTSLSHQFPDAPVKVKFLEDKNWVALTQAMFEPIQFGQLWICPSWAKAPSDAPVLHLDPGLAFGTGSHATTAMCLDYFGHQPPTGLDVIDYGCGSGILALACLKLGAKQAIGVDYDPQALQSSKDNREKNEVLEDAFKLYLPDEANDLPPADLVVANILLEPLLDLKDKFVTLVKPGGTLLLSGLLSNQFEQIQARYQDDFHVNLKSTQDDWCLVECTKP